MKIFTNKKLIQKIIIAFLCVFLLNFCMTPPVEASFGGSLFTPMKEFITAVADIFITLVQWGITGNWIPAVDDKAATPVIMEEIESGSNEGWHDGTNVTINPLTWLNWLDESAIDYPVIQISPELIFANRIRLLDIDFIGNQNKDNNDINSGNKIVIGDGDVVTALRTIIASWYVTLRTIAIIGLLSVLLYIGIRIIIASTSADKAKYKQMIMDWIVAFCILLFMHFIMAGTINIVEKIDEMLAGAAGIGEGISLDPQYGNVEYAGGTNNRLPGTGFTKDGIRELLSKYGIDVQDVNEVNNSNELVGTSMEWTYSDANGKVLNIKNNNGNYEYTIDGTLVNLDESTKTAFESELRAKLYNSGGTTVQPDTSESTQTDNEGIVQTYTKTGGDLVYVSTDPSKILYFINYARLYISLEDPATSFGFIILYIILIVFTTMFAVRYMKRVIYIAFLTLIAPLVALTYPIDKIKDGQAQAFNMWFREYIFNVMIQPFHLLIYTILVGSAMALASSHMIYAIVAIGFLIPAEKLLRKFFGFDKAGTLSAAGSFAGGAIFSSVLNKINKSKPGRKGGSGSSEEKSQGVRKPNSGIEMNSRDILFNRMADQTPLNEEKNKTGSEDNENESNGNGTIRQGNPPAGNQDQNQAEQKEIKGLTDSVFENSSKWALAKKDFAQRIGNVAYSKAYRTKTKIWDKARTLPKTGGRLIRKAAIGGLVGGGLGTIGFAVGAAAGDPSKAFSLAAAGGTAGYYGANYYGDKLAKSAGNSWQSSKVNFWGKDIKAIEQAKFDKEFLRNPDNRDTLIRALGSPSEVQKAIDNGSVQAFLTRGITDAGKIGKSLALLNQNKVHSLQEAVAVAEWNRDLGPAIFDPSSEHRANYINRTLKELKNRSSDPNKFDEKIAKRRIEEILDNINYLNI